MSRRLIRRTMIAGLCLILAAVLLHLTGMGTQILRTVVALSRLRPETICLALALSILSMLISGAIWWRLLLRLGYQTPMRVGLTAYLSAGLGGYLVSAAGPMLGCAVSLRRHGVCPARAVLLTLIANVLGFCGVLIWAPVGLLLLSRTGMDRALPVLGRHGPMLAAALLVMAAVVMLVVLWTLASASGAGNGLARRLLGRVLRPDGASDAPSLTPRHLLSLIPWSAASWFPGVLALYVVLSALNPGVDLNLGDIVGSAVLAATVGSLAFFVPSGMGVADGALIALLAHSTGLPVAQCMAAAIAVRALDPLTKLALLFGLAVTAHLDTMRPLLRLRAALWARWSQRPAHPTLRLPWYLWRAAFEEHG